MYQNVKVDGVDLHSSSMLLYYESSLSLSPLTLHCEHPIHHFFIIHLILRFGSLVGVTGGLQEGSGTERCTVGQSSAGHTLLIYTPTFSYHLSYAAISWGCRGTETWLPLSFSVHTCMSIRWSCSMFPFKRVVFSVSVLCASVKVH